MAKRNRKLAPSQNERGQISIFFSASLVVLVSIVAFVINVGIFVKAKINLQNATDAAAFAGAAVQARQLSKIGHLNWEMRNIYKEFLYKYYVVGNLNINGVKTPSSSGMMDFTMEADVNVLASGPDRETKDPYNFPSICIHLESSTTNICKRYAIPGLPEFGSSNLPGAEEASRAFQDSLITTKVNDCVERTKLNMYVGSSWAYNVLTTSAVSFANQGPAIMADRQGAWPRALELAMRIRNLEHVVNKAPSDKGVCLNPGDGAISCQDSVNTLSTQNVMGNERTVKAFYSGLRNIGGSYDGDVMKNSFTLTELPVTPYNETNSSNTSQLLIPGPKKYPKYFLDLKLMMVNYAIFYSAMIPRADKGASGACDVSKAAIPIPGYPLGFYKSPDVLTYYAVKGEAMLEGMFNPFADGEIKLTAYSAAKPMGGRIGPMLFVQKEGDNAIRGRQDRPGKLRSVPYIMTFDINGIVQKLPSIADPTKWEKRAIAPNEFAPGVPLPVNGGNPNNNFWLTDEDQPVGGRLSGSSTVQFGIPNLVYDYQTPFTSDGYTDQSARLFKLRMATPGVQSIGLYSTEQFKKFRGTLGANMSVDALFRNVARVRAPTVYETANYLVPVPFEDFTQDGEGPSEGILGHFGQIIKNGQPLDDGIRRYINHIYAPLFGEEHQEILYKNSSEVVSTIAEFMREQESGIKKYITSMNDAAQKVKQQESMASQSAGADYGAAAAGISDIFDASGAAAFTGPQTCRSLAGFFVHFYYGGPVGAPPGMTLPTNFVHPTDPSKNVNCPDPIGKLLVQYFSQSSGTSDFSSSHYRMEYSWNPAVFGGNGMKAMTAYMPGPFTGVDNNGLFNNLAGLTETTRRNFYSTKFVQLNSLKMSGGYSETGGPNGNFSIHSEGGVSALSEAKQTNFRNPLTPVEDTSTIKH